MASDIDFVNYVIDQIRGVGEISSKKMFGEYMVYVNQKPLILVCDNTAFVKMLPCIEAYCAGAERGFPYQGAKEHYILDLDNAETLLPIINKLETATKIPVKKKKR